MKRLTCQEVLDQLSDYLDDDARAELVGDVDHHLGICVHCRVEVDTLRRTIMIYRHEERVEIPTRLSMRLSEALERAYRDGLCGKDGSGEA
jgi:predicted anti-sigma-YlaC factor YlaD